MFHKSRRWSISQTNTPSRKKQHSGAVVFDDDRYIHNQISIASVDWTQDGTYMQVGVVKNFLLVIL